MKQLSVIGNLTADCKTSQNGALWFSMAVDNGKTQDGKKLPPLFVQVCGVPKQLEPYLKKDSKCMCLDKQILEFPISQTTREM